MGFYTKPQVLIKYWLNVFRKACGGVLKYEVSFLAFLGPKKETKVTWYFSAPQAF